MVLNIAILCLAVSVLLATYRVLRGPSWGDRVTAFDFLTVTLAVLVVVVALRTGYTPFLDAALLISILGFMSTAALARYLLRGRVLK
jgi:multicomponent K+:H+ antiporter subunit F/multicomponent Na+:H+ antiporter subunit F